MTLEEVMIHERKTIVKLKDKAWRARSEKVTQERKTEAEYHECVLTLLKELKERRAR